MDLTLHWSLPLVFASVTGTVLAISKLLPASDDRIDDRIRGFSEGSAASLGERPTLHKADPKSVARSPLRALLVQIAQYLLPRKAEQRGRLQKELIEAGYYSPAAPMKFLLTQAALAGLAAVLGAWAGGTVGFSSTDGLLTLAIAGCAGYLVPRLWIRSQKTKRLAVFRRSLPDFLDLMITCLQAGMTVEATVQRVSKEIQSAHPLLAGELARVQHEIEIGAPPDRALQSFGDRTDCDTIRSIAMVCQQSRKFGTKLATALRSHADALRERREHDAEEAAQKAAVKILIPTLLCLFPCIFVILAGPAAIQIADEFGNAQQIGDSDQPPPSDD